MAERTFTPSDLVSLPRLNASEALALLVSLESAARPHSAHLPKDVGAALESLKGARASLQKARAQRRQLTRRVDPRKIREADNALDRGWRAFEQWTAALLLLPVGYLENRAQLEELYQSLFGEGMGFLNERFEVEWAESDTRLEQIKREGLAARIEPLGGKVLLQAIRDAHRSYGELLGITAASDEGSSTPVLDGEAYRQLFVQVQRTIRAYVAEAAVLSHRADPAQQKMATALLKPLAEWSSRPTASASDDEDDGEDATEEGGKSEPKPQG